MQPRRSSILLIVIGSLLALGPVWGGIGTVIGMLRAFFVIGNSAAAPEQLAASINYSLLAMVVGATLCPFGLALLICGIIWLNRTKQTAGST